MPETPSTTVTTSLEPGGDRYTISLEPGGDRYTISLGAATLEELAELVALVHKGLGSENGGAMRAPTYRAADYRWSPEDETVLRTMKAGRATWSEIAAALGRTEKAVVLRWQSIRVRR